MGLERLAKVVQGKTSNYDTDVFTGTIEEISKKVNKVYRAGDDKESVAFRVIGDHVRAIAFPIADGQLPSNTGAGYVIRRILRRAVRYYYSYLDVKQPLLYRLLPIIAEQFKEVFPEVDKQKDFVVKVIKEEEQAFLRTLEKGLQIVHQHAETMNAFREAVKESPSEEYANIFNGSFAFDLFDTFGFPLDLTKLIASEYGLTVDEEGFEKEMQQQKNR